MDSSARRRRRSGLGRVALLAVLLTGGAHAGCRSAAAVFLDLPQEPADPGTSGASRGQPAPGAAAASVAADTIRISPPAEMVETRDSLLALLPKASDGGVDWVMAIDSGVIRPRAGRSESVLDPVQPFGFDFYFGSFETLFPHSGHVGWLGCPSCHPAIYRTRSEGSTITSMAEIGKGESCGVCHGPVAFGADVCERCHPQASMPEGRRQPSLGPEIRIVRDSAVESTYPRSVFSHGLHRIRYTCSACHLELYPFETGAASTRMTELQAGNGCGSCHDEKTAFGLVNCTRCHVSEGDADTQG